MSILNLRDLGGIPLADGSGVTPRGLYIRSGKLSVLSPASCARLCQERNIRTVIDLRTPLEVEEYPDVLPADVEYLQVPILKDAVVGISHETGSDPMTILRSLRREPQKLMAMMPDLPALYKMMVTDEYCCSQLQRIMTKIQQNAREGKCTLFHCTAGKDRTGIVSMLLLRSLGVGDAQILQDYCRTNRAVILSTLKKCLAVLLMTQSWAITKIAYHAFIVEPELLRIAMDSMSDSGLASPSPTYPTSD